jgi:hypothetical protein
LQGVLCDANAWRPEAGCAEHSLYVVNARFDTPPTPETEYEVVRVRLPQTRRGVE